MALYEITQDCRIANKDYLKWDIVSDNEVGGYYPSIMKATNGEPKKAEAPKVEAPKEEVVEEEVEEKKPAKKQWKKK